MRKLGRRMIEPFENEPRINYLIRVLNEFMTTTIAGQETIEYDGVECDGYCLAQDLANELNIDIDSQSNQVA